MKKILVFAIAVASTALLASCGNKTAEGNATSDSAKVENSDSAAAPQEAAADPKLIDTNGFTINLPEGWERNGEENQWKADLRTTETVPVYYVTIEFKDYRDSIDEWKKMDVNEKAKAEGELEAGGMKYTVMSVEDGPFYTMYIATMLPNDKGMLCATFHGETAKDKNEQKEVFKQILDAVKIK